jgi:hypothetical protein
MAGWFWCITSRWCIDSSLTYLGVDGGGDCFPQLLLRSDREDAPFAGYALQLVRAPVFEFES